MFHFLSRVIPTVRGLKGVLEDLRGVFDLYDLYILYIFEILAPSSSPPLSLISIPMIKCPGTNWLLGGHFEGAPG